MLDADDSHHGGKSDGIVASNFYNYRPTYQTNH